MTDVERVAHPSITGVGQVLDDGTKLTVVGWGLSWCAAHCACHRNPDTGRLALYEDFVQGEIGLVQFSGPCDCCRPWTAAELAAIARDYAKACQL